MSRFQKPSDEELRWKLSPDQYAVTQHEATELPRGSGRASVLDGRERARSTAIDSVTAGLPAVTPRPRISANSRG
jgi:hypothetical protein